MIVPQAQTYRLSRIGNFKYSRVPTDTNPPPAPTLISVTPADITAQLLWINGVDAETQTTQARVRYSVSGQNVWSVWQAVAYPGAALQLTGLTASLAYDVQIVNDDVAGNVSAALSFTFSTLASANQLAPGKVSLPVGPLSVTSGQQFTFAITRTGGGSASPAIDVSWSCDNPYISPQSGSVTFPAGQNGTQLVTVTALTTSISRSTALHIVSATSETGNISPSVGNGQCSLSVAPAGIALVKWTPGYGMGTNNPTFADDRKLSNQQFEQNLVYSSGPNMLFWKGFYYPACFQGSNPAVWDFTKLFRDLNKLRGFPTPKHLMVTVLPQLFGSGTKYADVLPASVYNDSSMGASPVAGKYGWWTMNGGTALTLAWWRASVMSWLISLFQQMAAAANPATSLTLDADPYFEQTAFGETSMGVDAGSDYSDLAVVTQYKRLIDAIVIAWPNTVHMCNNNYISDKALCKQLTYYCRDHRTLQGGPDTYAIGQRGPGTYDGLTFGQKAMLGDITGDLNFTGPDLRGVMGAQSDTQSPETSQVGRYTMFTPHSFYTVVNTVLKQHQMIISVVNAGASDDPIPAYPADGINTGANPGNWHSMMQVVNGGPLTNTQVPTTLRA